MELLYVWIEDYKNIYHQGFNFSPKYRFEFVPEFEDETKKEKVIGGELFQLDSNGKRISNENAEITQTDSIYDNFFEPSQKVKDAWINRKDKNDQSIKLGTITNITAIIGENGAGKSALLGLIPTILQFDKDILYILLLLDLDKSVIYCKHSSQLVVSHNYKTLRSEKDANSIFYFSGLPKKEVISGKNVDLTSHGIRKKIGVRERHLDLESENLIDQIEFILSGNILLPFDPPDQLSCKVKEPYLEDKDNSDRIKKYIKTRIDKLESDFFFKYPMKLDYFKKRIDLSIIQNDFNNFNFNLRKKLDQVNLETYRLEEFLNYLHNMPQYKKIVKEMYLNLENLLNNIENIDPKIFQIYLKPSQKEDIIKFIGNYMKSIFQSHYIEFYWRNMSSGESAMIILYSRFFSTQEIIRNDSKNSIIILIDEGEVGFHPEWQRTYLKNLIDFFPQIYPDKQIQIILTTHSPFLASDLPKENIIFLKKGKKGEKLSDETDAEGKCIVVKGLKNKENSFAANIHTLLSDGFFLEGGLIGEFAKGKINKIIDFYREVKEIEKKIKEGNLKEVEIKKLKSEKKKKENNYNEIKNDFKKIQKLIGEEYLAEIVQNHLEELDWILLKEKPSNLDRIENLLKEERFDGNEETLDEMKKLLAKLKEKKAK